MPRASIFTFPCFPPPFSKPHYVPTSSPSTPLQPPPPITTFHLLSLSLPPTPSSPPAIARTSSAQCSAPSKEPVYMYSTIARTCNITFTHCCLSTPKNGYRIKPIILNCHEIFSSFKMSKRVNPLFSWLLFFKDLTTKIQYKLPFTNFMP